MSKLDFEGKVTHLYDTLSKIESKVHKGAYPIHKRLSLPEDIYTYISKQIGLPGTGCQILDAGCGVGYGTLQLSELTHASITGITVSSHELSKAQHHETGNDQVRFELKSFDQVVVDSYDMVICVESLKHAPNIKHSIHHLMDSLRPNGKLVIVEDWYVKASDTPIGNQFMQDWKATELINRDILPNHDFIDLTDQMPVKSVWKTKSKLALYKIVGPFVSEAALALMRGATLLDSMYHKGYMRYGIAIVEKVR